MDTSEPDLTVSVEMEETPSSQIRGRRISSFADSTHGNYSMFLFYVFILTTKFEMFCAFSD